MGKIVNASLSREEELAQMERDFDIIVVDEQDMMHENWEDKRLSLESHYINTDRVCELEDLRDFYSKV